MADPYNAFIGSAKGRPNPTVVSASWPAVAGPEREIAILPARCGIRGSQGGTRALATRMRTGRKSPGEMAACRGARWRRRGALASRSSSGVGTGRTASGPPSDGTTSRDPARSGSWVPALPDVLWERHPVWRNERIHWHSSESPSPATRPVFRHSW